MHGLGNTFSGGEVGSCNLFRSVGLLVAGRQLECDAYSSCRVFEVTECPSYVRARLQKLVYAASKRLSVPLNGMVSWLEKCSEQMARLLWAKKRVASATVD